LEKSCCAAAVGWAEEEEDDGVGFECLCLRFLWVDGGGVDDLRLAGDMGAVKPFFGSEENLIFRDPAIDQSAVMEFGFERRSPCRPL
jgi:hypothetical protein